MTVALGVACFAFLAGALGRPTRTTVQLVDSLRAESAVCSASRIEGEGATRTGCLRPVVGWLGRELVQGSTVETKPAEVDGRHGFTLRVHGPGRRLVLFVPRAGGLPVALAAGVTR
jgi:hypothetical protein